MILGLGILLESVSIMIWFILCFVTFHIVVVKLEEPHLWKKYREKYSQYCKKTPRRVGIRGFKNLFA